MTITILEDQDGNPENGNSKENTSNVQSGGRRYVHLANVASKDQGKDKKGKALVSEEDNVSYEEEFIPNNYDDSEESRYDEASELIMEEDEFQEEDNYPRMDDDYEDRGEKELALEGDHNENLRAQEENNMTKKNTQNFVNAL